MRDPLTMLARLRPRLTYANVISTLCLFIVLGGGAVAAVTSFVQTGGAIRGCVTKKGQLTVLNKGKTKCKKGQTAIAWNQTGKPGAAGQQGAKGDTGPPGPATGPAGGDLTGSYPNPTIKPNVVSGANIDESTLGQVPSAANAANSSQLGGLAPSAFYRSSNVARFDDRIHQPDPGFQSVDLMNLGGVLLSMYCEYDNALDVQRIRLQASGFAGKLTVSFVNAGGTGAQEADVIPAPADVFNRPVGVGSSEVGTGLVVYHDTTPQVITIPFRYVVQYRNACEVSGTATRAG